MELGFDLNRSFTWTFRFEVGEHVSSTAADTFVTYPLEQPIPIPEQHPRRDVASAIRGALEGYFNSERGVWSRAGTPR
jgi:hypothetical protein